MFYRWRNWVSGELHSLFEIREQNQAWTQVWTVSPSTLFPLNPVISPQRYNWNAYQKWHPVFWWHPSPAYCKRKGPPRDSKTLLQTPGHHYWGRSTGKSPQHLEKKSQKHDTQFTNPKKSSRFRLSGSNLLEAQRSPNENGTVQTQNTWKPETAQSNTTATGAKNSNSTRRHEKLGDALVCSGALYRNWTW